MRADIKKLWVEALRSGEFEQTTGTLRRVSSDPEPAYCCLGVLCEVHRRTEKTGEWFGNLYRAIKDDPGTGGAGILPSYVTGWAGLDSSDPRVNSLVAPLSELNDKGMSFEDIANFVELEL